MISLGHRDGLKQTGYTYISKKEIKTDEIEGRYAYLIEKRGTIMIGYEQLNHQIKGMPINIFEKVRPAEYYTDIDENTYCQVCHNQEKHQIKHDTHKGLRACQECHETIYELFHELIEQTSSTKLATTLI